MENPAKWIDYFCALPIDLEPYTLIFNACKESFPDLMNVLILNAKYVYVERLHN